MRRFRFAPSPNGYLHLGHAYSALLNARLAAAAGGAFLLRIEDIDQARARPAFEAAIEEDLAWLGLTWPVPARRQSEHFPVYAEALEKLAARGLVYPAFETRAEIARLAAARGPDWPRDPDGAPLYPGGPLPRAEADRRTAGGEPYALRLDMRKAVALSGPLTFQEHGDDGASRHVEANPLAWGDVVLARKEVPTSYHLSVVVDDALQGITDVVRGRDLFDATAIHRVLQHLLDLPHPHYRHHRLLRDRDGNKLAKSAASTPLRQLRRDGLTPAAVAQYLAAAAALPD